jgi:hypothetical protein
MPPQTKKKLTGMAAILAEENEIEDAKLEAKGTIKVPKKRKQRVQIVPEEEPEPEYQTWAVFGEKWCAAWIGRYSLFLMIAGGGEIALGILLWPAEIYTMEVLRRGTWWTGALEFIQSIMGLILWGSIEDQQMQNFMGTCVCFFALFNLLICGILGSITECYDYEHIDELDALYVLYTTISCYMNITFAVFNFITMVLASIWPPQFLDVLMQDQALEDKRIKQQAATARDMVKNVNKMDFKEKMLNGGPMRTGNVKKLAPMR